MLFLPVTSKQQQLSQQLPASFTCCAVFLVTLTKSIKITIKKIIITIKGKPPEEKAALCYHAPTARFATRHPATAEAARPFAALPPARALLLRGGAARRACAPPGAAVGPRPFHRTAPGPPSAPRGRAPHCALPAGGSGSAR